MRLIDADELFTTPMQCARHNGKPLTSLWAYVVRCRDCKRRGEFGCPMYYEEYIEWDDDGYRECDVISHDHTFDDGFCDRGERKGG